mgnify:CR=1 FL=1
MKKSINLVLTIIAFLAIVGTLTAAEPQTKAGSKSIFWGLNGLSDLSVNNSFLGIQYLFADKMGVWGQLNLSMISEKPNSDADGVSTNNIGLSAGFIYYVFQKGPVGLYLSPQVGFYSNSEEDKDASTTHKDSESILYLGVSIGAEWWFTDNVSLIATSLIGFGSTTTTVERGSSKTESTSTVIGIIPQASAKFEICFYF